MYQRAVLLSALGLLACGGTGHRSDRDDGSIEETPDLATLEAQPDLAEERVDLRKAPPDMAGHPPTDIAPTVGSLAASPSQLTASGSIWFAVTVTHPLGAQYIDEVTMREYWPSSPSQWTPLTRAGDSNVFEATLTWADLNAMREINFTSTQERVFEFYVRVGDGWYAGKSTSITLSCSSGAACHGACRCSEPIAELSLCTVPVFYANCAALCEERGGTCKAAGCDGKTVRWMDTCGAQTFVDDDLGCYDSFKTAPGYAGSDGVRCCCE